MNYENSTPDSTIPIGLSSQLSQNLLSPYIVGRPIQPGEFFNRQTQVVHFFSTIGAPQIQCLSILGLWGSGKTSFLNHIRHRPVMSHYLTNSDEYLFVVVNLRQVYQQTDFYHKLIEALAEASGFSSLLRPFNDFHSQGLRILLDRIAPRRVAILLDGFDQLFPPVSRFEESFFTYLRSLVESYQLAWVTTSYRSIFHLFMRLGLNPHESPFCNIFSPTIYLGALSDKEADDLIGKPTRIAEQVFNPDDISWLKTFAGGLPAFLQRASQALFYARHYYPNYSSKEARRLAQNEFAQWAEYQFTQYWKNFTREERDVLICIASEGAVNWAAYTHKYGYNALDDLTVYGLVTETDTGYQINGKALADWIHRQASEDTFLRNKPSSLISNSVNKYQPLPPTPDITAVRIVEESTISGFKCGYALIIGIATYPNPNIRSLPNTIVKDAQDIDRLLRSPEHCGYLDANVQLLVNEQATAKGIRNGFNWLAKSSGAGDTTLVFFSGHGGRVENNSLTTNYLIPYDCSPDHLSETAISSEELTNLLCNIKSQRLVICFDSCYSGGTGDTKAFVQKLQDFKSGLAESYYAQLAQGTGRVILASSRSDEMSLVLAGMDNSLFTHYLLEALQGGACVRGDGLVRIFEVFDYISEAVPIRGSQHPIFKASDLENNFPIALYLGGKQSYQTRSLHTAVDKRELRDAILWAFNLEELDTLCADVQQELANTGIKLLVNPEVVGGSGKEAKVLNLISYLERRDFLAALVKTIRRARPGII